jgi:hypothetical protein
VKLTQDIDKLNADIRKRYAEMQLPQNRARAAHMKAEIKRLIARRKILENQRTHVEDQRLNVDVLASKQEQMELDAETASAMKAAQQQMKGRISVDDAADVLDDAREMTQEQEELAALLGGNIGGPVLDDGDLEAELEGMLGEVDSDDEAELEALLNMPADPVPPPRAKIHS